MYFEHEYIVKVKGNSDKAIIADIKDQIEIGIYCQLGNDIPDMEIDVKAKNLYYKVENGELKNGFFWEPFFSTFYFVKRFKYVEKLKNMLTFIFKCVIIK